MTTTDALIARAAEAIANADALIVTAGAGMGVNSGLPDFRGTKGFWRAYPALRHANYSFQDIATPHAFHETPALAWGFYGHRLALYRSATPHQGYNILLRWTRLMRNGAFVFTSNVDGHFQRSGFPEGRVVECHGSIHVLQCLMNCADTSWSAARFLPKVDAETCKLINDFPRCPNCGGIARPNILMFNDDSWVSHSYDRRREALDAWQRDAGKVVVVELGAGRALPTVRNFGARVGNPLVRINTEEAPHSGGNQIYLQGHALDTLRLVDRVLSTG